LKTANKQASKPTLTPLVGVGFFRRLVAMVYDVFLLLAILFLAAAILLLFNEGEAVTAKIIIIPYYLLVSFGFYGWFWMHNGQTAGLKTWKIRLKTTNGQALTWKHALIRFLAAILSWALLGFGFLWVLVDKNNYALHDYLSKTVLVFDDL